MQAESAPRPERPERGERGPRQMEEEEWHPSTKLGRLVKAGKIESLYDIFKYSLPIKETEIIDHFLPKSELAEEVCNIMSV